MKATDMRGDSKLGCLIWLAIFVAVLFVGYKFGAAQWACGHETEQRARARAVNAVHSPLRHRVNGVFVNMPEFAEAFQCKVGQAMVKRPEEVCRIW